MIVLGEFGWGRDDRRWRTFRRQARRPGTGPRRTRNSSNAQCVRRYRSDHDQCAAVNAISSCIEIFNVLPVSSFSPYPPQIVPKNGTSYPERRILRVRRPSAHERSRRNSGIYQKDEVDELTERMSFLRRTKAVAGKKYEQDLREILELLEEPVDDITTSFANMTMGAPKSVKTWHKPERGHGACENFFIDTAYGGQGTCQRR